MEDITNKKGTWSKEIQEMSVMLSLPKEKFNIKTYETPQGSKQQGQKGIDRWCVTRTRWPITNSILIRFICEIWIRKN